MAIIALKSKRLSWLQHQTIADAPGTAICSAFLTYCFWPDRPTQKAEHCDWQVLTFGVVAE